MTSQVQIVRKLHELADFRLMGEGPWIAERDFVSIFTDLVRCWGLEEVSPRDPQTSYTTSLGH